MAEWLLSIPSYSEGPMFKSLPEDELFLQVFRGFSQFLPANSKILL